MLHGMWCAIFHGSLGMESSEKKTENSEKNDKRKRGKERKIEREEELERRVSTFLRNRNFQLLDFLIHCGW